jgi:cold shock CspA family protein
VTAFDDDAGLGEITSDDGEVLGFQCTRIADGSRTVDVGARVVYEVAPGHRGRWEAVAVVVVAATG